MREFTNKPIILGIALFVLLVAGVTGYKLWSQFNIIINIESIGKIKPGDKVYMDDLAIGEVKTTRLVAPGNGLIKIRIKNEYTKFLNTSTVFTITGDRFTSNRQSVLCKNCNNDAPKIKKGYTYEGVGYIKYKFSCLGNNFKGLQLTARELWESRGRDIVLDALETGKEMTNDTINFLKEYEKVHHDEFVGFMELMKKEVKEITPEIQHQIDELLKK